MLDGPVSPHRKRALGLGLLAGLMLGSGCALVSDRRSGRVFNSNELSRNLPGPLLERLPCHGDEPLSVVWRSPVQLLADGPLSCGGSVALIPVGEIDPTHLDSFTNSLRQALGNNRELLISSNLLDTRTCDTQLLLTATGATKREELRLLREQLVLQGNRVAGWVLIDSSLKA